MLSNANPWACNQTEYRRRESKGIPIHFRDDLSEYSSPSSWGDGPGPLSLLDHRLANEGLQARRTAGEALIRAEWERRCEKDAEAYGDACRRCLGFKTAPKLCFTAFRRSAGVRGRPSVVFTWADVQSIILLPCEEKGPYLIAVTTYRQREDGSNEFILQAGSLRARTRWGVEMMAALLRERLASETQAGHCKCVHSGRSSRLSSALFMDFVRMACEVARLQPSADCMGRLAEVLELLGEAGQPQVGHAAGAEGLPAAIVHFPLAALQRFRDATLRARADFLAWQSWREVALLLRCPPGWDEHVWKTRVLPFVSPQDPSLCRTSTTEYPSAVDLQLVSAAERCRRTFS